MKKATLRALLTVSGLTLAAGTLAAPADASPWCQPCRPGDTCTTATACLESSGAQPASDAGLEDDGIVIAVPFIAGERGLVR